MTKEEFKAALRAQLGKQFIPAGLGNDLPFPRLGVVDAAAPSPAGALPPPGADAAAWRACFEALRLRPSDLAALGPDVCGPDEAANVAMLSADLELAGLLAKAAESKAQLGRTSYEVGISRAYEKARRFKRARAAQCMRIAGLR